MLGFVCVALVLLAQVKSWSYKRLLTIISKANFGVFIPLWLLIDICFYYQTVHNTLSTMHSLIFYNMFRPFVLAIFRQNYTNMNGKVYWVCFPTGRSYFSILNCTFAQEMVHSSIFRASSGLRKVTTSISWTALNGTQCD
jgi:hypothetical protein